MASPSPPTPPPKKPHDPNQLQPTAVTFDPQGWTVVHPSTPPGGSNPGIVSGGSQSKTNAPGALDDAVGQTLGAYEIQGTVARGGQGVVYKARHRELGTPVALKLLLAHKDPRSVQLFRQEAQILARLRHPNVIVVTDLGEMMGVPFLAMDFVQGADLKSIVNERGPLGIETARNLLAPIARTLQYCHDRGLVHRDVKPQNILIEEQTGRPILIDFGLVKRAEQFEKEYGELTTPILSPIEMGGTPSFMAPEQTGAPGFGPTGPLSDVYGLGSTLYFLLTGKAPFVGAKTLNTLNMVVAEPPVDPRKHRPDIPEPLAELCLWAMAKKPEERPPSAEEFARALKPEAAPEGDAAFYLDRGKSRRDENDLAGALSDLARAAEMLAPGDPREKQVEAERLEVEAQLARVGGTRPAVWIAASVAFLLLAGALTFALLRTPGPAVDASDKTPPEVAIAPVAEWDGGPLAVSCTVRDAQPKGVKWQLLVDNVPAATFDAAVGPSGRVDARFDPAAITSGTISMLGVVAIAEDLVGNTSRTEVVVPIRRQPPRISIESPRGGLVTNERTVDVRAIVGSARLRDAHVVLRVGDEERASAPMTI
ncbi:MAG: serine/threonine protein kinase, partial [Planctomycetota bacterium]